MIWGYPHFRKPLYIHIYTYIYIYVYIYIYINMIYIYIYFSRNMPCYHLRFLMGSHTSKLLFPSGFVQKMLDISCNPWVMLCRLFPSTPKGTSTPWQCNATICFDISKQNEESFVTVISDASQCASATCWDEVNWTGQILLTARFESEARPSTGGNFPERINLRTCCDPSHRTCRCTGGDGNTQSFGLGEQAGHLSKLSIYTCDGSISRKQREKSALWCPVYSWNFLPTAESCSSVLNSQWQVVWANMLVNITRWLWFMAVYGCLW